MRYRLGVLFGFLLVQLLVVPVAVPTYAAAASKTFFVFHPVVTLAGGAPVLSSLGRIVGKVPGDVDIKVLESSRVSLRDTSFTRRLSGDGEVERRELELLIAPLLHSHGVTVSYSGPQSIHIKYKKNLRDGEIVVKQAKKYLSKKLADVKGLTIRHIGSEFPRVRSTGDLIFSSRNSGASLSRRCVWVSVDGGESVPLWFSVEGQIETFVLSTHVAAGSLVGTKTVVRDWVELKDIRGEPIDSLAELKNKRFSIDARAGRVITRSLIQASPAVAAGDRISVESRAGLVRISILGKALSEGEVGDDVRVKSLSNNEVFTAHVTGKGQVVVTALGVEN